MSNNFIADWKRGFWEGENKIISELEFTMNIIELRDSDPKIKYEKLVARIKELKESIQI